MCEDSVLISNLGQNFNGKGVIVFGAIKMQRSNLTYHRVYRGGRFSWVISCN